MQTLLASGMGVATRKAHALLRPSLLDRSASLEIPLVAAPVFVPRDFAGLHAHRWPVGTPTSPAPTFGYGAARSHDFDGAAWYRIHVAPNRFDWSALDQWIEAHAAAHRTLVYTLYGTPAWLAEQPGRLDLYGWPGGASAPRDCPALSDFITALVHRYNGVGRRRLHFIETWNEPHFDERDEGYWWGSASQLVRVGRTIHLAAKKVDPGIRVLSPGFVGDLSGAMSLQFPALAAAKRSSVYQYLTASDGFGGVGSQWCDGVAFHTYNVPSDGENSGYLLGIRKLQKMLALMQIQLPLVNTELGFTPDDVYHQLSPRQQGALLRRIAAVQAALGVQALFFYAFDDDLIGNPSVHPEVAQALGDVHSLLAGKTLQQVTLQPSGQVKIVTSERTLLW